MSLRFIVFFFTTLFAVHLYFLNTPFSKEALTPSEFALTQVLNQSDVILLLLYSVIAFWKSYPRIIYLLFVIYFLYLLVEALSQTLIPIIGSNRFYDFDYFTMIVIRIIYTYIFINNGVIKRMPFPVPSIAFLLLLIGFNAFVFFRPDHDFINNGIIIAFSITQIIYVLVGFRNKYRDNLSHYGVATGIIVSSVVDSLYLYDIYVKELDASYTWIRFACSIGEFLLAYGIVRNILINKNFEMSRKQQKVKSYY